MIKDILKDAENRMHQSTAVLQDDLAGIRTGRANPALIEKLHVEQPDVAVVILTTFNEDALLYRGLQAGARGYLLKDTDRSTLFDTIRAAARGETLLKPEIMSRLLSQSNQTSSNSKSTESVNLTDRELEVLILLGSGLTVTQSANALRLSVKTVSTFRTRLLAKMGFETNADIVQYVARHGLLTPGAR